MGLASYVAGLLSFAIMKIAIVNILGGAIYGYVIGYVAVYLTIDSINDNCTKMDTEKACSSLKHTECYWDYNVGKCGFTNANCTDFFLDKDTCKDSANSKHCFWDYGSGICVHKIGFTSVEMGLFACAMTIGAVFGCFAAGPLADKIGRKWSFFSLGGCVACVASVIMHIARATDIYALHFIGRLLGGFAIGAISVIGPMYIFEMCPKDYLGPLSVYFQLFCTFGIFGAALVGIIIEPMNHKIKQTNEARIHVLIVIQTILSFFCLILGFMMRESDRFLNKASDPEKKEESSAPIRQYTYGQMIKPLFFGTVLSLSNQLTGMNAIMNYAPIMTGSLGLRPMLGNFIIMLWNFITTFISIPLSTKFAFRTIYLGGIFCACGALIIVAVTVTPGVASEKPRQAVGLLGILLFILCFAVGIGPPYFLLAQQLFPKSFRPKGQSYCMGIVFIFNIIINACYPIAVTNISGGPSGNQNIGMCAAFYFFLFTGASCGTTLYFYLYPYPEEEEQQPPAAENPEGN